MKNKKVKRIIDKAREINRYILLKLIFDKRKQEKNLIEFFINKSRKLYPNNNRDEDYMMDIVQDNPSKLIPIDKSKIKYVQPTEEGMKERLIKK